MARPRIYLTGQVVIEHGDRRVNEQQLPGRQGRLAFVFLAVSRTRPVTRGELATAIWGDHAPPEMEGALNAILSKLRGVLKLAGLASSDAGIEMRSGSVSLRLPADTWIDLEDATNAIDETKGALRRGDIGRAWGLANIAVTVGRRPFLADFEAPTGWAPIMGVGYYQTLVQWSKGEYPGANNTENDLTKITGYGFTYRPDDHGNTPGGATPLIVTNGTSVSGGGIIERTTDKDAFSFLTGAGTITLNVTGAARGQKLDIRADLYDGSGAPVATANVSTSLNASMSYSAAAGTYTLVVDGAGNGDLATGYSDYASLGEYTITGTIVSPGVAQPPVAVATAAPTNGNIPLPRLKIMVESDPLLKNQYSVIAVSPAKFPSARYCEAMEFIAFVTSPEGQKIIASYAKHGVNLFYPDAIPVSEGKKKGR